MTADDTWEHHFTPQKNKLGWDGNTQISRKLSDSTCASQLEKLWHLYSGMQRESSALKSMLLGHNNQWNTYYDTLPRLRQAVRRKRPVHHSRERILQHDNATPHSTPRTRVVSVVSVGTCGHFTLWSCPSCLIAEGRWSIRTRFRNSRHVRPGSLNKRQGLHENNHKVLHRSSLELLRPK
jgi:hypothetical protein